MMVAPRQPNDSVRGVLRNGEPMSRHTAWGIGGPARRYFEPADADDLVAFLRDLPTAEPVFWLGLGSNLLVRDGGIDATVICTAAMGELLDFSQAPILRAGAGVACPKVARRCARQGLAGLEFFAGIPGTVGGALAMNAGAFGGETWERVRSVTTVDAQGHVRQRGRDEYQAFYRGVDGPGDEWFLEACFDLEPLGEAGAKADLGSGSGGAGKVKSLLARRAATQPLGQRSCGSVFRNPEGDHAARLIESCGLKGTRIGGAVVSPKHANFIINEDSASAADVEALIAQVVATVQRDTGVTLMREVRIVGELAPAAEGSV